MSGATIAGVAGAVVITATVLRLVHRRQLLVKYAALWLIVSTILVIMALIPHSLTSLADAFGFVVPSNLLFFLGFVVLLLVAVQLSVELTTVERRVQRLAEELALLKDAPEPRPNEGRDE